MFFAVPASHGWQVAVLVSKYVPSEQTPVGESVIVGSTVGKGETNTLGAAEGCEAMADPSIVGIGTGDGKAGVPPVYCGGCNVAEVWWSESGCGGGL